MATLVNESMAAAPTTGTVDTNTTPSWNAGGWYNLTTGVNQYADFYYTGDITSNFDMTVDMRMSTTSGADASWFFWGVSGALPPTESTNSYMVQRNDFGNNIILSFNGTNLATTTYTKDTNFDTLEVIQAGANFTINYAGSTVISYTDPSYPRALPGSFFGWGARCGGIGNVHDIKNLLLNTTGDAIPAMTFSGFSFNSNLNISGTGI